MAAVFAALLLLQDPLSGARALKDAKRPDEAIAEYTRLATSGPSTAVREAAHYERAALRFDLALYQEAHADVEAFLLRFPQSERLSSAKRLLMESALLLAKHGATGYFGVPTGSGTGVEHLREALRRYPREDFSSDFAQRLGMFFYERSEFDKASEEFSRVFDQYADGPDAVLALYMLGRCAEARFDALDYDSRSLKDARRHYERFLDEAEKMKRLPEPAAGWVERLLPAVRERLGSVYERLLAKRLQVADYYEWKGLPKSARLSYAAIVREEASFRKILPALAETPAVVQARKRLAEIKP